MEEIKTEIITGEVVKEKEPKLDKHGNPIIRDEHGRFPPGVAQPYSWEKGKSGNPKGRKKGTSWAATLEKVMEEELAGISKEEFMVKMVKRAYDDPKDKVAGKFVSDLMPKPPKVLEIQPKTTFVVPDLYADRKNKDPEQLGSGESDDEYDND